MKQAERYDDAYSCILQKNDALQLIRLMGKTGIIIDRLDEKNIEFLMDKIIELIRSEEFVDLLLPWLIASIDKKVPLTLNLQGNINECLLCLLNPKVTDHYHFTEVQLSEINRIANILGENLASINN